MTALLPQLEISTYSSQIFWLLITFSILYFSLSRVFLPNIHNLLKKRDEYIEEIKKATLREEESILFLDEEYKNLVKEAQEKSAQVIQSANNKAHQIVISNHELIQQNINALKKDIRNNIKNKLDNYKFELKSDSDEILEIISSGLQVNTLNKDNLHSLAENIFEKIWVDKYKKI